MKRLTLFLEAFQNGTKVKIFDRNEELLFEGLKEDVPHRLEDRRNVCAGKTTIKNDTVKITIEEDKEE